MNKWILPNTKLDLDYPYRWRIDYRASMVISGFSKTRAEAQATMAHICNVLPCTRSNIYDNWIPISKLVPKTLDNKRVNVV